MRREHGNGAEPDQVEFGPVRQPRLQLPGWASPPRLVVRWLAALAVIATGIAVVGLPGHSGHVAGRAAPWFAVGRLVATASTRPEMLGERGRWDLFAVGTGWEPGAVGQGVLVRIQLATGQVSRTTFPALPSEGPVPVVPGPRQVLISPPAQPGFEVPDGRPASLLPGPLEASASLPGPDLGQVWLGTDSARGSVLRLVTMTGGQLGPRIVLPVIGQLAFPDDRGYLLFLAHGRVYDASPAGARDVGSGVLFAAGPAAWLLGMCRPARHCLDVVVNPVTGARRVPPGTAGHIGYPVLSWAPGPVSPDGRFAALLSYGRDQSAILHLVDLRAGIVRTVDIALGAQGGPGLVWSPDSRWLFAATASGALRAIDPRTDSVRGLGVALPPVTYLAVRAAG